MLEHVLNLGNQLRTDLETSEGFASVDYERILIVGMGGSGDKALKILRSRILDNEIQEKNKQRSQDRKNQVGSGDRSERIRTYNFPQGRVSDHRINLTLYNLTEILEGNLDELINPLIANEETNKLADLGNE